MDKQTFHFDDLFYTVVATPYDYHVDFAIYELAGTTTEGERIYGEQFVLLSDDIKPVIKGFVKWDGCSNWSFETTDCMLHLCGRQDAINLGTILSNCWGLTKDLCPNWLDS